MRDDDFYGNGARSSKKKRKNADKILNISIGIVVLLIFLVGGQLFLGGKKVENAVGSQIEKEDLNAEEQNKTELDEPNEIVIEEVEEKVEEPKQALLASKEEIKQPQAEPVVTEPKQETTKQKVSEETKKQENKQAGKWKPIGTVQKEPFHAIYEKDHVNWEEMKQAFQVATGLDENITLWNVSNGGNHLSAVGIVADAQTRTTPYKVRIEWVTNEGWMPVSVEKLEENPYLQRSSPTPATEQTNGN